MTLDMMACFMAARAHGTELRADGDNLGPPAYVNTAAATASEELVRGCFHSGAAYSPTPAPPAPRCEGPPDPMFLAWLKACRPVLHRIVTREPP